MAMDYTSPIGRLRASMLCDEKHGFRVRAWLLDDAFLDARREAIQELVVMLCNNLDDPFLQYTDEQRKNIIQSLLLFGCFLDIPECMYRVGLQIFFDDPSSDLGLEKLRLAASLGHDAAIAWLGENEENDEGKSNYPKKWK